jgi:hypothetical protein
VVSGNLPGQPSRTKVADHILNNFFGGTPLHSKRHRPVPRNTTIGGTPLRTGWFPSPSTDLRIHTTERCGWPSTTPLRLCLHLRNCVEVFAELPLLRPVKLHTRSSCQRESHSGKAGDANARTLSPLLLLPRQNHQPATSPPREPKSTYSMVESKDQPLPPSHQPHTSQTPSRRIMPGSLHSVCSLGIGIFPSQCSFPPVPCFNATHAEVMTPSPLSNNLV